MCGRYKYATPPTVVYGLIAVGKMDKFPEAKIIHIKK